MAFEIAVKEDYEYDDGIFANLPCHAHLVVVDADEDGLRIGGKNNNGSMVIEFEIVAANDPSQVGLHFRSYFTRTIDAGWVMLNFAIAAGIKDTQGRVVTAELIKALKDAGKGPEIDFETAAIGCQLFGKIDWNIYTGRDGVEKKSLKIQGRDFYNLTSRQCTNKTAWPRNESFIAKAGIKMPTATASAPTSLNGAHGPAAAMHGTKSPPASTPSALNGLSGALAGLGKPK